MTSILLAVSLSAWPSLPLPGGTSLNLDTASEVSFGELVVKDDGATVKVRGPRWRAYATTQTNGAALWAKWKPLLVAQGWKSTSEEDGHSLKRTEGKLEWRLRLTTPDYDSPLVVLAQAGGSPRRLELKPPSAAPVKDDADLPWAPGFPGQKLTGSGLSEAPFIVAPGTKDVRFIADAQFTRSYEAPPSLSRLEAVLSSADALKRAGWDVAYLSEEEGYVQAHYTKGRDLWLQLSHREDGTDRALTISVVDVGAEDLGKALDTECKLTLRGVTFDFNKATLKAESDVTLGRVAAALSERSALKLEVSGHTDAEGSETYNQTLSEARAASVVAWLTKHGVASGRLTARGFGESRPVADNGTDEGRAKNRRVELNCVK